MLQTLEVKAVWVLLNSKYIYQMETASDYQFFGLTYSNVSGYQTKMAVMLAHLMLTMVWQFQI